MLKVHLIMPITPRLMRRALAHGYDPRNTRDLIARAYAIRIHLCGAQLAEDEPPAWLRRQAD